MCVFTFQSTLYTFLLFPNTIHTVYCTVFIYLEYQVVFVHQERLRLFVSLIMCFFLLLQAVELRVFFRKLGAEISEEKSPKGIEDDLHKIIGVCDACFKTCTELEIESILNAIVSMLVLVSPVILSVCLYVVCGQFTYLSLFSCTCCISKPRIKSYCIKSHNAKICVYTWY